MVFVRENMGLLLTPKDSMPFRNGIIFLTFAVLMIATFLSLVLPSEKLAAYGTIFAAAGSFIAVFWFGASLHYQSVQLKEQREQFNSNFAHLREDAKRKAILVAKEMLIDAEEKAVKKVDSLSAITNLPVLYMKGMAYWKDIVDSKSPEEVMASFEKWLPLETSAKIFINGIKNAAEVYLRSIGTVGIDYSESPEKIHWYLWLSTERGSILSGDYWDR